MTITVRFAPSPTGFLHIGGARTALFNWLYAKHMGGKFLLRVEDTDVKRSTTEAKEAILEGLKWLGLEWDGNVTYQMQNIAKHAEAARQMVEAGHAYYCYLSAEELDSMRKEAEAKGEILRVRSPWRDKTPGEAPEDGKPVIRLKAPLEGTTILKDLVQGEVTVNNTEIDDLVLLRSDGTPTYMLAVVVDDHNMGVTHVIRGDDHLTNTFKQIALYKALGWDVPTFAHVALIHGADGAKLSKRHGALGVEEYRKMGYLPEALCNYLVKLGWGHGDDEIISREQAIEWFDIKDVGKAPSRFDFEKLGSINAQYIQAADNKKLLDAIRFHADTVETSIGRQMTDADFAKIEKALPLLKPRARTLVELAQGAALFLRREPFTQKALSILQQGKEITEKLPAILSSVENWEETAIKEALSQFATTNSLKVGQVFQPLRAATCGTMESPDLIPVLVCLGKEETLSRLASS